MKTDTIKLRRILNQLFMTDTCCNFDCFSYGDIVSCSGTFEEDDPIFILQSNGSIPCNLWLNNFKGVTR